MSNSDPHDRFLYSCTTVKILHLSIFREFFRAILKCKVNGEQEQ